MSSSPPIRSSCARARRSATSSIPDRIVVGTDDERAQKVIAEIYRPLYLNQAPIMYTGRRTAELIKYAANAFLATKVTFINEIADLAEEAGADVQEVARGIGLDNRIGSKFLHAGPGFGGSCFPKDTRALVKTAQDYDVSLRIVEAVLAVNETRKRAMARKVAERARRQSARQDHRRARPRLQAEHRRHARGAVDPADHALIDRARPCAPTIRRAWSRRAASCRISNTATTPMRARRAPTRW